MKNRVFIIGGIIAVVLVIGGIIGWRMSSGSSEGAALDGLEPVAFEKVSEDDAISEKEYMALLNEAFSYEDTLEYSDNKITGKEAVAKGGDRLGPAYRDFLLEETEDTPENRFDLVQKKGALSKDFEEAYLSQAQAEALIKNFTSLATLEDYHVSKSEYQVAENVVDGSEWTVTYYTSHEDGSEEALIEIKGDAPAVGEKLIYLDTVGVLRGGIITAIEKREGDTYDVMTTQPDSLDELLSDFTVAGYVDWSELDALNTEDGTQTLDSSSAPNYSFVSTESNKIIRTTITVTGEVSSSVKTSSGKLENDLKITGFTIGNTDYSYLCDSFHSTKEIYEDNIYEPTDPEEIKEKEKQDRIDKIEKDEGYKEVGTAEKVEIDLEDFQLYEYVDEDDSWYECSFTPVLKVGDVSASYSFTTPTFPCKILIGTIHFNASAHVDMEMENVSVVVATENPLQMTFGADKNGNAKKAEKVKLTSNFTDDGISAGNAEISLNAGVAPSASLTIAGFPIITSKVDVYLQLAAEQLDIVEGYDTACWEGKFVGPMIDLYWNDPEEASLFSSVVSPFLAGLGKNSGKVPLLTEANTFKMYCHMEFDDPPKFMEDPEHDAAVCTHVAADGSRSKIKRKVDYTLPKEKVELDKDTAQLYQDFLDGKVKASVVKDNNYPDAFEDVNKEYSIDDLYNDTLTKLSKQCEEWDWESDYDYSEHKVEYIDAGKDENYEMVISYSREHLYCDWARVILRNNNGKLEICYRYVISLYSGDGGDSGAVIYYNGVIADTSSGVWYGDYESGFLDGDGKYHNWYRYSTTFVENHMYLPPDGRSVPIFEDDNNWGIVGISLPPYEGYEADCAYSYICPEMHTWEQPVENKISFGEDPHFIYDTDENYKSSFDAFAAGMAEYRNLNIDNDWWMYDGYYNDTLSVTKSKELVEEQRQKIGLTDNIYYLY
ncbi:hypothetical protein SAMN02910384_01814 [Pseudobutyrivibrio sp. ACV-2]|uniref:hypothetical protein n=1 Tax=Pseudobutyrivibrio sp. ACV-2 TaxID=1520801 RepID=UPI0008954D05|nr:hypothetical protein [Pseudobutyrivibrio sp. ACV-2]SEA57580.1 hypothetical protein SAMN02910384_01814 [Pseudobutyrivibrio sp. ACV-2]